MSRWYRAYAGTISDDKIGEVAAIAETSKSVAIATWHALLESCALTQDAGRYETTARRIAVALGEPPTAIERVFAGLTEVGMIADGIVCAWSKRQFESDNSTERSRKHREAKKNVDATLQERRATSPSVCASVSVSEEETLPRKLEVAGARETNQHDELLATLSAAAGEMPCAVNVDTSPIGRLITAGWHLERDILPGIREMARAAKRPVTWQYVANTLIGKAQDARAGPPPDAKPETASQRFARKQGLTNGDGSTNPGKIHSAA